jgi:hypothetical protein
MIDLAAPLATLVSVFGATIPTPMSFAMLDVALDAAGALPPWLPPLLGAGPAIGGAGAAGGNPSPGGGPGDAPPDDPPPEGDDEPEEEEEDECKE